jgi:hypothetical protein
MAREGISPLLETVTIRRTGCGHAILMTDAARASYPASFAVDEVIEWEHDLGGHQMREASARLKKLALAANNYDRVLAQRDVLLHALKEYHAGNRLKHDEDARLYELSEAAIALVEKGDGH